MSASATFTMLVSSTAMMVPIMTEPAINHLCGSCRSTGAGAGSGAGGAAPRGIVAVAIWSVRLHVRGDRHAGTQRTVVAAASSDLNAHGNSLYDFGKVAGGVVRW